MITNLISIIILKNICRKASQQLNVLKRIGCFLSKLNKLTIFHTFILSNFNFCPLAWHFCNKSNTSKLEKIQARALRFIYEDYGSTYDELLEKAKVPSLKVRRMRTMAIECFKILNKLSPSCLHDLVVFKDCKYNFRYSNIVGDQPFNLKGGGGGGLWFIVSFRIFISDNTRVIIFIFFCRAKREKNFQNLTLGYMAKTLNQIIIFFSTKIRIFFSASLGIRIFF